MGHITEAVGQSWASQAVRIRGCSTSSASAVAATNLHKVCTVLLCSLETWLVCRLDAVKRFLTFHLYQERIRPSLG